MLSQSGTARQEVGAMTAQRNLTVATVSQRLTLSDDAMSSFGLVATGPGGQGVEFVTMHIAGSQAPSSVHVS